MEIIPRHWRLKAQRYRLEDSAFQICGKVTFPPRPVCQQCFTQAAQNTSWKLPVLQISSCILDNVFLKEL